METYVPGVGSTSGVSGFGIVARKWESETD